MCARNEGKIIAKTLDRILNQTIKPNYIVVVDDGSSDTTPQILDYYKEKYGIIVIRRKDRGYSAVSSYVMANVYNAGLRYLRKKAWKYLFIVPADMKLMKRFNPDHPIGGGRMIRREIFDYMGGLYPLNFDHESSVVHCARYLGYDVGHFKDIKYSLDRIGGKGHPTKYIEWGRAMKDANYHPFYVIGRSIKEIILKRRLIRGIQLMIGFVVQPSSDYPDYSIFLREYQKNQVNLIIKGLLKKFRLY